MLALFFVAPVSIVDVIVLVTFVIARFAVSKVMGDWGGGGSQARLLVLANLPLLASRGSQALPYFDDASSRDSERRRLVASPLSFPDDVLAIRSRAILLLVRP